MDSDSRQTFIKTWAKQLGCEPNEYACACALINDKNYKNFMTAIAVVFGLSATPDKEGGNLEYIKRAAALLEKEWQPTDICTPEWLDQFVQYYIKEVEPYPENAK